jgi:lysophospholipid acyltransferase (LPLAT)-like uncharacterized protein
MKINSRWATSLTAFLGACLVRGLGCTLRYRYHAVGPVHDPYDIPLESRYICVFWHENLLLPAYQFGRPDIRVLISQHRDGELIARICRWLGFGLVRGSTTRGGVEAVRELLRVGRESHVAITPDGPRGPRRRVQAGVVYLAARMRLPIIPMGIGYDRPWRAKSWDRFAFPRPWSRACCITGAPIQVPADASREELETFRLRVERALECISQAAESWAEAGNPLPSLLDLSTANTAA